MSDLKLNSAVNSSQFIPNAVDLLSKLPWDWRFWFEIKASSLKEKKLKSKEHVAKLSNIAFNLINLSNSLTY